MLIIEKKEKLKIVSGSKGKWVNKFVLWNMTLQRKLMTYSDPQEHG